MPESSKQSLQMVEEAQSVEQQCRELKIAADRKAYREEVEAGRKEEGDFNGSMDIAKNVSVSGKLDTVDTGEGTAALATGEGTAALATGEGTAALATGEGTAALTTEGANDSQRRREGVAASELVAMDAEGSGDVRNGGEVTFGELLATMEIPAVIQNLRTKHR